MPRASNGLKFCTGCKITLPVDAFHKAKTGADKLQSWCNKCKVASNRNRKYGLAPGVIQTMEELQNGRCSICNEIPTKLFVDHCHKTGQVRALLCIKCNSLLGMCQDSSLILAKCISYVEKWKQLHAGNQ